MKKVISSKIRNSLNLGPAVHKSMFIEKLPGYFLIVCLLAAFGGVIFILTPFLTVIFIAAVLAITFYPLYSFILKRFKGWKKTASFVTCMIVVFLTVIPMIFFSFMITGEAQDVYNVVEEKVNSGEFDEYLLWDDGGIIYDKLRDAVRAIDVYVDVDSVDLKAKILKWSGDVSGFLVDNFSNLFTGILNWFMNFMFMMFAMYYFFKDGKKLVEKLGILSPLPAAYESELFRKIKDMVNAIMVGVFLTAIVQGVLGGLGFAFVGISSPVFWGTAMAIFSLVPMIGTAIIWVPAVIILFIMGLPAKAIFLFIWGVLVVGGVDNFLRPYLIGAKAHTYPLLTFFVILGGIFTLQFKGIIIGPLLLMFLMSILHIYEVEYSKVLKR